MMLYKKTKQDWDYFHGGKCLKYRQTDRHSNRETDREIGKAYILKLLFKKKLIKFWG